MITDLQVTKVQNDIIKRITSPDWSWEEAIEMGLSARGLRDLSNWAIGLIALGVETKWGEDRLGELARVLGFERSTLMQYRWVVKQFGQDFQPAHGLPWSYYRIAAGAENPQEAIEEINDQNMGLQDAKRFVKGEQTSIECEHDVETKIIYRCKKCGKTLINHLP